MIRDTALGGESDDGSAGRALGHADVLDILEIVDGAGDECGVVVEVGDFRLHFVKEAAGEGKGLRRSRCAPTT